LSRRARRTPDRELARPRSRPADSTPAGIACGSDCVETYTDGQVVIPGREGAEKSLFKRFTGCDSVQGNTCTVTLNSDRLVV
jgi:hypothetical protein